MIKVFIDANIWLLLYNSFSVDILKQFGKLKSLMRSGAVSVILTKQIKDEVSRNREKKLKEVLDKTENIQFNFPFLYNGYDDLYKDLYTSFVNFQNLNKQMRERIHTDIFAERLPQDVLIKEMFELSNELETSPAIIEKAITRWKIIGNPPGKDDKCGDAISWETLLDKCDVGEDIFFISDDKDFRSVLDEGKIKQFLSNEWEAVKNSKIYFYRGMSEFISKHIEDIRSDTRKKQDAIIEMLENSGSFATTHRIIEQMAVYDDWTIEHVEKIAQVARRNNQISWILSDDDISEFMKKLLNPLVGERVSEEIEWLRTRLGITESKEPEVMDVINDSDIIF